MPVPSTFGRSPPLHPCCVVWLSACALFSSILAFSGRLSVVAMFPPNGQHHLAVPSSVAAATSSCCKAPGGVHLLASPDTVLPGNCFLMVSPSEIFLGLLRIFRKSLSFREGVSRLKGGGRRAVSLPHHSFLPGKEAVELGRTDSALLSG